MECIVAEAAQEEIDRHRTNKYNQFMTPNQFEEKLKALLNRKPFQPFAIELNDGERWVVGQREALMYLEGQTGVYFRADGTFDFVDCGNVRQLLELTPMSTP